MCYQVLKGVLKNLGLMPPATSEAASEEDPAAAPAAAATGDDADADTQTAGTILAD